MNMKANNMRANNMRANKTLGQHFLHDEKVIQKIVSDFKQEADVIVEVGPGPGALTKKLHLLPQPYWVIEKDDRFIEPLQILFQDHKKNQVIHQDALNFDWNKFIEESRLNDKKIWLVSNLPYNVGVPLLIQFLQCPQIHMMTLMWQKEVALKILGESHDEKSKKVKKDMGSLCALTQNYFNVESLIHVKPHAFTPPPKVQSLVLRLEKKAEEEVKVPRENFLHYEKFLRHLFQHKRKYLTKGLSSLFSKEELNDALNSLGIAPSLRAETLNLQQVQQLYLNLYQTRIKDNQK